MRLSTDPETGDTTIDFEATTSRRCGDCTLCCRLLPNATLRKPSVTRCQFQRHGKGCLVYHDRARRPMECETWSCRWLASPEETAGMPRPDRCHFVIDPLLDKIRIINKDTGHAEEVSCLQIWVDPAFPETMNDPRLRAYLFKMAEDHGWPALLRWSNRTATAVFAPPLNPDGTWYKFTSECNPGIGLFSRLPEEIRDRLD